MNCKWVKVGLLYVALGLTACPSGTTNPAANNGTVTVTTAPNNVVSIGALGTNFKTADATGKAVFTGLKPGAVDVHVFSADGHSATSYMGVNTAVVVDDTVPALSSVIDVYVQVVNAADVYGFQSLRLHTADNDYIGSVLAGDGTLFIDDKPVGTPVMGTLFIGQGSATSSVNTVYGLGEAINLGNVAFTTQAAVRPSSVQQSFLATFSATPVTPPLLAAVQSITPPTGFGVERLNVGDSSVFGVGRRYGGGQLFPDTIHAADTGNHTWYVSATDAAFNSWEYRAPFTVGASLSVTATLTVPPKVAPYQTGSTISWSNPAGSWSLNHVLIQGVNLPLINWDIVTDPSVSSITLPTLPSTANLLITAGTTYEISVENVKNSGSYVEAVSNPSAINGFERVSTKSMYIR